MNQKRLGHILAHMEEMGLTQMIVCDPASIYYLTGQWVHPGERLLALLLRTDGQHRFFVNRLFHVTDDPDAPFVWYSDTEDPVEHIAAHADRSAPLGIDKDWPARFLLRLIALKGAESFVNASRCVDRTRACKDLAEQALMREASRINDLCMAAFRALVREGVSELEIAREIPGIYEKHGADKLSFPPIVAFGANASDGHHMPDDTRLRPGDCVLFDVGCGKDGYCSDMTRTFFYKHAREEHQKIYDLVRRANETAEELVRPGVRLCDLDAAARDLIAAGGYGQCFTHRLGHSIGFECHEAGDVSATNTDEAKPGMIFSVEPGIYLPGDTGVRIEDLVLVTETGCEILNHYPKELDVIV